MEIQIYSELLEIIEEQSKTIGKLNNLIAKLITDNAEKENWIEFCAKR